jgi:16S rRNA G527 N7-methylase RsmG
MTSGGNPSRIIRLETGALLDSLDLHDAIGCYLDLLGDENAKVNLVSRETSRADLVTLAAQSLIPTSIEMTQVLLKKASRLLDIGSGGGYPAVPLLLAHPNLSGTLLERRQKKARALARIVRSLNLNAEVIAEDFDHHDFDVTFDLISLRFVTLTPRTLSRARSVIAPEGAILYYGITEPGLDLAGWRAHRWCYALDDATEPQHLTVLHRLV